MSDACSMAFASRTGFVSHQRIDGVAFLVVSVPVTETQLRAVLSRTQRALERGERPTLLVQVTSGATEEVRSALGRTPAEESGSTGGERSASERLRSLEDLGQETPG